VVGVPHRPHSSPKLRGDKGRRRSRQQRSTRDPLRGPASTPNNTASRTAGGSGLVEIGRRMPCWPAINWRTHIEISRNAATAKGPAEAFTGEMWVNPITRAPPPSVLNVAVVRFTP
jgi:hypothetical protein